MSIGDGEKIMEPLKLATKCKEFLDEMRDDLADISMLPSPKPGTYEEAITNFTDALEKMGRVAKAEHLRVVADEAAKVEGKKLEKLFPPRPGAAKDKVD